MSQRSAVDPPDQPPRGAGHGRPILGLLPCPATNGPGVSVSEDLQARAEELGEDATSARILDAALERFELFGVRRTTMDDVASAAGIGRATLYRRFAGRDEIVRATILREMARFIATVDEAGAETDDPRDQLVEGFVTILRSARTHPVLARLLDTEPDVILPFLTVENAPLLALCRDYLTELIAGWREAGHVADDVEPQLLAELLVRLSQSLLVTPRGAIDADDQDALRHVAGAYLVPLVFGHDRR